MFDFILCQSESLSAEWVKYIVGGLAVTVISLGYFIKWIFTTIMTKAETGIKEGWASVEKMHKEGVERFDKSLELQISNSSKMDAIQKSCDENRDAVQTLNTKIKCKEAS